MPSNNVLICIQSYSYIAIHGALFQFNVQGNPPFLKHNGNLFVLLTKDESKSSCQSKAVWDTTSGKLRGS